MKKTTIKMMILLSIALVGCASTPMPEYNYRLTVPYDVILTTELVTDFSRMIMSRENVLLVSRSKLRGVGYMDSNYLESLQPQENPSVTVDVAIDFSYRLFTITIRGDVKSDKAQKLATVVETLLEEKFPNKGPFKFDRKRGLLGP